jgi:putative acetyltransferase
MDYVYTGNGNQDFVELCKLLDENLNEIIGYDRRSQYDKYNTLENIHDVIVAYDGNNLAGCASFRHYDTGIAEVKRVFVKKEYRGRGISKQLMLLLEDRAREKGYKRLILETGLPLKAAIELYKNWGI